MADNILSGKVVITAPGVEATFAGISDNVAKCARAIAAFGGGVNKFIPPATAVVKSFGTSFLPIPAAAEKAGKAIKGVSTTSSAATQSLINLGRVAQDAPFGFIGIANNLNPLLESFQRLKATSGSTGGALKALGKELGGAGGLGFALSIVSSLAIVFGDKLFGVSKSAEKAKSAADSLRESISGIFKETAKEATEVGSLITVLKSETETRERRLGAIKELQRIQPEIFAGLKLEGDAVVGLDNAYTNYLGNLKNVIAAKIIQAQVEQKIEQLLKMQGVAASKNEKALLTGVKNFQSALQNKTDLSGLKLFPDIGGPEKRKIDNLEQDIKNLFNELSEFSKSIEIKPNNLKIKPGTSDKLDLKPLFKDKIKPLELTLPFDQILFDEIRLGKDLKTFAERLQEYSNSEINKAVKPLKLNLSPQAIANNEAVAAMRKAGEILTSSFAESLGTGLGDAISSVGEGIGNILSGKDFGTQIFQVLGTLIQNLGKALIQFAVIDKVVKLILANPLTIGPGLALAAGIAAIAAGALIKNIAGARAAGGPVSGGKTYLVGERGPELFTPNTGGQIIPNDRLGSGRGFASGGMAVRVTGEFLQRGKDLLAVITLADQSKARLQ